MREFLLTERDEILDNGRVVLKGLGPALAMEKAMAERAAKNGRFIVIATADKVVPRIATTKPLPVEVDAKEMTLEEMTAALESWYTSRGVAPKNIQELVKAGFIKKMPTPPAGKDFAIDATNLRVVLVDRLLGN